MNTSKVLLTTSFIYIIILYTTLGTFRICSTKKKKGKSERSPSMTIRQRLTLTRAIVKLYFQTSQVNHTLVKINIQIILTKMV
jgi:hypothetical protein